MRFLDLLSMSVNNLRRRKLRTALTVLGVVIGTASIVVMVSLGIGLQELTMEMYSSSRSMNAINVYSGGGGGRMVRMGSSSASYGTGDSSEPKYLTDDVVKQFEHLPNVDYVSPILSASVIFRQGIYEANATINGVTSKYMEQIPLGEGEVPKQGSTELQLIYGNFIIQWFSSDRGGSSYWETGELPDIDYMNKPMFVIFDTNSYYQARYGGAGTDVKPPKKYMIDTAGVVKGSMEDYSDYSYNVYADIELLKAQLKKVFKKNPIPGQPTNKKDKPYNYFVYDQVDVFADDMDHVMEIQKQINDMGYQAISQVERLEQSQQQSNMIQAVLGGIGAVSLFVAAIGIANTMMMSIYERTREIGVIKVLGCDMGAIRNMFLIESGFIGFMGGIVGIALSYTISTVINKFLGLSEIMMGIEGNMSRIPSWLALSAIGFAIIVGMVAGLYPSFRAMRLSPLAAIRND